MKAALFLATSVLAGLAASQCSSSIPACAQTCISNAAQSATSCGTTDYKCQCTDSNWQAIWQSSENCLLATCGDTETYGQ